MSLKNRLGQYAVSGILGSGAMGEVYRATDSRMFGRPVAIKVLSDRLSRKRYARSRFKREVEVAAKLSHPNIVTIHDRGEYDGRPFFVMEYLDGIDLCRMIRKGEHPSPAERIQIARQVCDALQFAHENHVVHRDIKPANIMVIQRAGTLIVKLVDFGIVHVEHSNLTRAVTQPGTFSYMSPEQLRREEFDHRSDLFSLGIVLYELFAGTHPFEAASEPLVVKRILEESPAPVETVRKDLPEGLSALIMKLLEKDPEARPRNAGVAAAALQGILIRQPARRAVENGNEQATLGELNERFVENFVAWGRKREAEGEFQEALDAYRKAWTLNPDHESVRALQLLFDEEEEGRGDDPARDRFVQAKIRLAEQALEQGKVPEARSALEEVIERHPDEPLARLMLERNRVIQASGVDYQEYRAALQTAEACMESEQFRNAREACECAGKIWPEDGEWKSAQRKILDRLQSEIARRFTRAERLLQEAERKVNREEDALECVEMALNAMYEADALGSEKKWTRPTIEEATRLKHDLLLSLSARKVKTEAALRSARKRLEEALEAGREFLMRAEDAAGREPVNAEETLRLYEQAQEAYGEVLEELPEHEEALESRNRIGREIERLVRQVEENQRREGEILGRLERARGLFAQAEKMAAGDLELLEQCMAILATGRHEVQAALSLDPAHRDALETRESFDALRKAVERRRGRLIRQQAAIVEAMQEGDELLLEGSRLASGGLDEMRSGEESCRAAERAFNWILSQERNHTEAQDRAETLRALLEHLQSEIERRERGLDPQLPDR